MARSYKKNPVSAITCSDSEKEDKRFANRAYRRKVKEVLNTCNLSDIVEDEYDLILPEIREVSDVWSFDKDGKRWYSLSTWKIWGIGPDTEEIEQEIKRLKRK